MPYETNNRMAWRNLDYAPGGLLVADQSLVDGRNRRRRYYQYAGRRSPRTRTASRSFAPRFGFAWRPIGEKTVFRGGYGVFFDSAEGREIDGAADVYPYVEPRQLRAVGRPADAAANVGRAVPELRGARRRHAGGQHVPGRQPVTAAAGTRTCSSGRSACSASHRRAPRVELNYIGTHGSNLLMRQNIAQAFLFDPANPQSVDARKPYPELRRLHRQQLERPVELQRAEHQARASRRAARS